MGKTSHRSPLVSPRRRVLKASSGVGVKKNRGSAKVCVPTPPPIQSLVDEDSGFGGDQSLDSESSLLSAPGNSNPGLGSLTSILPSLAMVPQTKLLLVSLLQGAGDEQGTGTSQKNPGNVAVGAFTPTTQLTISNGTSQTGNTHGAVTSSGAEKEWHTPHSVGPLVAGASGFSLQGASCTEVVSELPSVSTNSPSNYPTGTVPLGNTSHKGIESKVNLVGSRLPVDVSGDEAQELPESLGFKNSRQVPPLISFRDVSLLSSLHALRNTSNSCSTPVVRVEGNPQPTGRSKKLVRQSTITHGPPPLNAHLSARSSDGSIELILVSQPEEQHRARYQTEGSRGAVKDRDGKGHPTVKLVGYSKPTSVQVFVGDDSARTSPHMFYQVCRVSGKNSTPCKEKRIEGTVVIEATFEPEADMTLSSDCVGILKERNVDVEHRFKAVVSRGRKKSTKCCLVFRTFVTLPNGVQETLQVVSRPITCTQPPGVPEISRKSLSSCLASGGEEIFIFGKNFSTKDTVVIFQENSAKAQPVWEQSAIPEKDTLQNVHLIVTVPKYYNEAITEEVTVQMVVSSGGKMSEPHNFTYLPIVSKKELQGHEIPEEKFLPKGVSLGALQLNRHYAELNRQYAETKSLPPVLQEVSTSVKPSNTSLKRTSGRCFVPMTKSMVSSVRVPRVVQSSTPNRRVSNRTSRTTAQISKTPLVANKTVVSSAGSNIAQTAASVSNAKANVVVKKDKDEEKKAQEQAKLEQGKGTVSLGTLVELLNVVQSLPSGSIEELVRSMKENITTPGSPKMVKTQDNSNLTLENRSTISLSNILQGKIQKCSPQTASVVVPQDVSASKIIPSVTTTLGLWPLTLLPSVSTSQSLVGGPRVTRVAPIAPTTVVSSPGLNRTVRVCVAEAPNISLEPPKKKSCDHLAPMDYELVERNQVVNEPVVNCTMTAPIVSQSPEITYSTARQPTTQEVISNQCDTDNSAATAVSTTVAQESSFMHSATPGATETSTVLTPGAQNTLTASQQQPIYQNITESLLHTISHASQQVTQPMNVNVTLNQASEMNPPLNVSLGQSVQQVNQPMTVSLNHTSPEVGQTLAVTLNQNLQEGNQPLNVSCLPAAPEVNQVRQPESQVISQHTNPQEINLPPAVPTSAACSLFTQSPNMETPQMVVAAHTLITSSTSNQVSPLAPQSVVSSALTHSDPLLSQSVAPLQLDQSGGVPTSRNQPTESRPRAEVLMTPSSTAAQVSMQNDVTSAINLSETEFLNYFDPNCFDNV